MTKQPHPFAGRPYVILTGDRTEPPPLEEVMKPGAVTAVFTVKAGALSVFEAGPMPRTYLDNGVPVIVVFEDAADARELHRKIQEGAK